MGKLVLEIELDDEVIKRLREREAEGHRPVVDQIREQLEFMGRPVKTLAETRASLAKLRQELATTGVDFGDTTEMIAEDRRR